MDSYLTQTEAPLFPKVLWNRPLTKTSAGRLLLIGGYQTEFQPVQAIYQLANASGIGECTVVMPDSLQKLLQSFQDTTFVASSPSGSLGKGAINELLHLASEYDGLSVGASLSNNSETAMTIERILSESQHPRCLYLDALDIVVFNPKLITANRNVCMIVTMPELFRLAGKLGVALNIQPERGLLGRVELVQSVAGAMKASLVYMGKELIIVSNGQTSVTPDISARLNQAIYATMSVFWTHKPNFEQLTTAAFIIRQISNQLANEDKIALPQIAEALDKALRAE